MSDEQHTSTPQDQDAVTLPPQSETSMPQEQQQVPPPAAAAEAEPRKLSRFLIVSIILLAALTIASISLLFIGDFEGRFERVFSTFTLFMIFILLTAFDTRRGQSTEWYAPVALIANAYILGLGLIVIWVTPYYPFELLWEIMWKSLVVILVSRATILACQLLLKAAVGQPVSVGRFAFVTSVLAVFSGVLYTAPIGIDAFGLYVPDLYWRIATALLILTGLSLSITLLLRWFYTADERAARKRVIPQAPPADPQPATQQPALLPWPLFSDGRPYPAGPDGQPDFEAARREQQ